MVPRLVVVVRYTLILVVLCLPLCPVSAEESGKVSVHVSDWVSDGEDRQTRWMEVIVPPSTNPQTGVSVRIDTVIDDRDHPDCRSRHDQPDGIPACGPEGVGGSWSPYGVLSWALSSTSVAGLVREAVTAGLRGAGYRVLEETDEGYEEAVSLEVTIHEFWLNTLYSGVNSVHSTLDYHIVIKGPVGPFSGSGRELTRRIEKTGWWKLYTDSKRMALRKGIKALILQLAPRR